MNLNEAIEVLKSYNVVIDIGEVNQAIDTVVEALVKPLPTDEEIEQYAIENELESDSIAGFSEMKAWIDGAMWMRDAHLNTGNKIGLDEKLDEKVIELSENQESLSHNKDKKFSPELLQTHYPFVEEMDELLTRKKLGMATIIKAQSIITRCHLHGMEVGYEAAIKFTKQRKDGN